MKDIIDKRNEKEQMGRSIIKSWNVNYVPAPPQPVKPKEEPVSKEQSGEQHFNVTTGSYSGLYGQGEVDEVDRRQIEAILHEKSEALLDLIENENDNQ